VVGADNDDSEVSLPEVGVDVEHEFFGAARDTNWGPGFSLLDRGH